VNIIYGSELGPGSVPDMSTKIAQLDLPEGQLRHRGQGAPEHDLSNGGDRGVRAGGRDSDPGPRGPAVPSRVPGRRSSARRDGGTAHTKGKGVYGRGADSRDRCRSVINLGPPL
jgi:hypothetical protein